jgi:L-ascorbate oxidase
MLLYSYLFALLLQLFLYPGADAGSLCTHDESFVPDAVLRVTAANISQSCYPSKSTVLVNGTSPGPELRLTEGKTYWIRVHNDMSDANLTMVYHEHKTPWPR